MQTQTVTCPEEDRKVKTCWLFINQVLVFKYPSSHIFECSDSSSLYPVFPFLSWKHLFWLFIAYSPLLSTWLAPCFFLPFQPIFNWIHYKDKIFNWYCFLQIFNNFEFYGCKRKRICKSLYSVFIYDSHNVPTSLELGLVDDWHSSTWVNDMKSSQPTTCSQQ